MAVLTMQQVLIGVQLPLAVALAVHTPGAADTRQGQEVRQQAQQAAGQHRRHGWWHSMAAAAWAWRRVWARCDATFTTALTLNREDVEASGPQLLLCLWMLLGNAWLLSKAAAIRSLGTH